MATFIGLAVILIALIVFVLRLAHLQTRSPSPYPSGRGSSGCSSPSARRKRQLRASVVYEALLLSLIGIPLGVLSGIAGIGVTLRLLSGVAFLDGMRVHASPPAIALAAAIALVTVLISAHIPAKRAMRVTAIDAIRQTADVQAQKGREPSYRLTYRLFGLPGLLAAKHFRRSRPALPRDDRLAVFEHRAVHLGQHVQPLSHARRLRRVQPERPRPARQLRLDGRDR